MDDNSETQIGRVLSRYPLILVILGGLIGAVAVGMWVGSGDFQKVGIGLFCMVAMSIGLWMGPKVWLVVPILFAFDLPGVLPLVGGRSVELTEVGMAAMSVIILVQFATRLQKLTIFRKEHVGPLLYIAWAAFIFVMNPVGLAIMGSSDVGFRFYIKLGIALIAFIICANQRVTERDSKLIIACLVFGSFVSCATEILNVVVLDRTAAEVGVSGRTDAFYTWQQALSGPPMMIVLWMVSRYRLDEIISFSKLHLLPILMACIALTLASGKRAGLGVVLLTPMLAAFIRKQYRYIVLGVVASAILLVVLVAGHGTLFRLPLTVQRSLGNLPGDWDSQVKGQFGEGLDSFRATMRELAWDKIRKDPIVAKGYGIDIHEYLQINNTGDRNMAAIMSLAIGSSWHNTWLGIWADLGLPALIFWAVFWIQAVVTGAWVYRYAPPGSSQRVLGLMLLLNFLIHILRSWTSGHSALNAYNDFWAFGVLVSLKYTFKDKTQKALQTDENPLAPTKFSRTAGRAALSGNRRTLGRSSTQTIRNLPR